MANPVTNNTDNHRTRDSLKRRKKKKSQKQFAGNEKDQNNRNTKVYISNLLQALRDRRRTSGTGTIRETADRVLAVTEKGRSRWSRAILKNKLKLRFMKSNRRQRGLVATATGNSRLKKPRVRIPAIEMRRRNVPAVERKTRVLGRLVPGCRKQPLPVVLEEVSDYIPALEMQVKAMSALVELFSGGSSSSAAASSSSTGELGQFSFSRPPPWV